MRKFLVLVMVPLALSACVHGRSNVLKSGIALTADTSLPAPTRTDLVAPSRASLIGPADSISVEVFGVPDLTTRELLVDAGGGITLPLVGSLQVAGMTPSEISRLIADRLRGRYVRNPDVVVNLRTSVSQTVTVEGAVTTPGLYPVTNQTTLLRAIAAAKGVQDGAKLDDVVILRTVNNRRMAGLYNLSAIRAGQYADPAVYASDEIIVGDSPSYRLVRQLLAVTPLLIGPLIAILQ